MARLLVLLVIIAVTSSITGNEISEKVPLLFPRACGIHGWKKCRVARRRSHLQVTGELMHVKVPSHYIFLKAQSTPHVVVVVFFFFNLGTDSNCQAPTVRKRNSSHSYIKRNITFLPSCSYSKFHHAIFTKETLQQDFRLSNNSMKLAKKSSTEMSDMQKCSQYSKWRQSKKFSSCQTFLLHGRSKLHQVTTLNFPQAKERKGKMKEYVNSVSKVAETIVKCLVRVLVFSSSFSFGSFSMKMKLKLSLKWSSYFHVII